MRARNMAGAAECGGRALGPGADAPAPAPRTAAAPPLRPACLPGDRRPERVRRDRRSLHLHMPRPAIAPALMPPCVCLPRPAIASPPPRLPPPRWRFPA